MSQVFVRIRRDDSVRAIIPGQNVCGIPFWSLCIASSIEAARIYSADIDLRGNSRF